MASGIQLHLDGEERLTSLGAVQFQLEEPEEDEPAGLWLAEAVTGTGLSWHLKITLPPDRAELRFEARIFNRTFGEIPYAGGMLLPALGDSYSDGAVCFTAADGNGVVLVSDRGRLKARLREGDLVLSRFDEPRMLAPRQLDTWSVSVLPVSGIGEIAAASTSGSLHIGSDFVKIQSAHPIRRHKLVLLTAEGKTLEAPVDVQPEHALEMKLPEPIAGAALLDPDKEAVLRWDGAWPEVPRTIRVVGTGRIQPTSSEIKDLEDATFPVATRHIAHLLLGVAEMARGRFEEADLRFEHSLLYNAEDHLTWWLKAMSKRLGGQEMEEMPELLNAHYLAPLEPALRAESYLAQPGTMEKEPAALLRSLADFPESFIEVAALLVEAGLYEQGARWIDEAIRHDDLPMLRYLLAYCHIKSSKMDFEAQDHILAAAKAPLAPPYPWREIEIRAIDALRDRFPDDERLKELCQLYGVVTTVADPPAPELSR